MKWTFVIVEKCMCSHICNLGNANTTMFWLVLNHWTAQSAGKMEFMVGESRVCSVGPGSTINDRQCSWIRCAAYQLFTFAPQVASRALGVPTSKIYISETSTNTVPNTSPTAASVSADINGMAVHVWKLSYFKGGVTREGSRAWKFSCIYLLLKENNHQKAVSVSECLITLPGILAVVLDCEWVCFFKLFETLLQSFGTSKNRVLEIAQNEQNKASI